MYRLPLVLLAISILSLPVSADGLEGEVGYSRVTFSDSGVRLNYDNGYGFIGYRWDHNSNYSSSAELLLIAGTQANESDGFVVVGGGYKGTLQMNSTDVQLFWRTTFSGLTAVNQVRFGNDDKTYDQDLAVGAGLIWKHVTVGYTTYLGDLDGFDAINIGYKF